MTARISPRALRSPLHRPSRTAESFALTGVGLLVSLLAVHLDGVGDLGGALDVLALSAAGASTILLGVAAGLSGDGRTARVAVAIGVLTAYLAVRAGRWDDTAVRDGVLIVMTVVLASALLRTEVPFRGRSAIVGTGAVVAVAVAGSVAILVRSVSPEAPPPAILSIVAGVLATTVSAGLLVAGIRSDQPVLRRVGFAVGLVATSHLIIAGAGSPTDPPVGGAVLELAGTAVLVVVAGYAMLVAIGAVWRQQEEWQAQLAAAEVAAEAGRDRDHEMRNLLLGLSGAAKVLTLSAMSTDVRLLQRAASAEIERLRQLLEGAGPDGVRPGHVDVGAVLHDLGVVHRAGGLEVLIDAPYALYARIAPEGFAQVVTNLLVNCSRHAPGARVRLRAGRIRDRVVVRVADDGPGLPPGRLAELLARGGTGPTSSGQGLGLAITADLVRRCGGTLAFEPTWPGRGCTVVVDIPIARTMVLRESVTA